MPGKLNSIQAMRALAAWMVVAMHGIAVAWRFAPADDLVKQLVNAANAIGHAGVDLFFVISGAIMFLITRESIFDNRVVAAVDFGWRRAMRILPLFWLTLVFSVAFGAGKSTPDPVQLVRYLLLVDMPVEHPVAWTLIFEIRFYFVVAVLILIFWRNLTFGFIVASVSLAVAVACSQSGMTKARWIYNPLMFEFIFGIGVGLAYVYAPPRLPRTLLVCGIALMAANAALLFNRPDIKVDDIRVIGYGVPAAMILYGAITMERIGAIRVPKFMIASGDASYSVYLWHYTILHIMAQSWAYSGLAGVVGFLVFSCVIIAIGGHYSFEFIERPLIKLGRQASDYICGLKPFSLVKSSHIRTTR